MNKVLLLSLVILFSGCGMKTKIQKRKVEQASYKSWDSQYNYGQDIKSHHQDIKNLQYEVDQLMDNMNKD